MTFKYTKEKVKVDGIKRVINVFMDETAIIISNKYEFAIPFSKGKIIDTYRTIDIKKDFKIKSINKDQIGKEKVQEAYMTLYDKYLFFYSSLRNSQYLLDFKDGYLYILSENVGMISSHTQTKFNLNTYLYFIYYINSGKILKNQPYGLGGNKILPKEKNDSMNIKTDLVFKQKETDDLHQRDITLDYFYRRVLG